MIIFDGEGGGVVGRVDPRLRLAAVLGLAVTLYAAPGLEAAAVAVGLGVGVALLARVPGRRTARRLAALNLFFATLLLTVPLSTPGQPLATLGPLVWSQEGVRIALRLALQGNAVMLAAFALLASLDPVRLGWGLQGLGVPSRLVQLFLLLVRYIEVMHQEYHRLADAARVRCFSPRLNGHTLTSLGYLVGQLLLRSLERAERILAAMRCRGFDGRFHLAARAAGSRADALFAVAWLVGLALVGVAGWRGANR